MSFTIRLINPPTGAVYWHPIIRTAAGVYYYLEDSPISTSWTCPMDAGTGATVDFSCFVLDAAKVGIGFQQILGASVKNNATYEYNWSTNKLNVITTPPPQYTLTVSCSPTEGGLVDKFPLKPTYASGDKVTLTAYPAPDYKFVSWSGDISATTQVIDITVTKNLIIVCNFESTLLPGIPIVDQIITWIRGELTKLKEFFEGLFASIGAAIKPYLEAVVDLIISPVKTVVDWIQTKMQDVWSWVQDLPATITVALSNLSSIITSAISNAFVTVKTTIEGIVSTVTDFISGVFKDIITFISTGFTSLTTFISTKFTEFTAIITGIPGLVTGWLEGKLEELFGWVEVSGTTIWDKIKHFFKTVWDNMVAGPKWLLDQFSDFRMRLANQAEDNKKWMTENIADPILDALRHIWQDLESWFVGIWDRITGGIKTFFTETLPGWFQSLWEKLRAGAAWVWDKVKDLTSGFFDNIINAVSIFSPIPPEGGITALRSILTPVLALLGGLTAMTVAGNLVHPLHSLGLEHVSAMVYDLTNYRMLTGAVMGVIAATALRIPTTYHFNRLLRPYLPDNRAQDEMRNRGLITREQYFGLLAYRGLPDQWHDLYESILATPVRYFGLAAIARSGTFNADFFDRDLHRAGYPDETRTILLDMFAKLANDSVKGAMSGSAVKRFKEGFTTESQFGAEMTLLGYSPAQFVTYLAAAKLDYAYDYLTDLVAAYRDAVRKGNLSLDQYRQSLLALGMVPERVEGYILRERARLKPTEPLKLISPPTPTYETDAGKIALDTLRRQRRKLLISRDTEFVSLLSLGLDTNYANAIADNDDVRLAEKSE